MLVTGGAAPRTPAIAPYETSVSIEHAPACYGAAMPPSSRDRSAALDLLDAHLEALWDGTDGAPPGEPVRGVHLTGDGLVAWALDRLRDIPREPKADFRLHAGTLLAEFRMRRCPWNAAALRLLDDTYTFVAVGPRQHPDWAHDFRAVLNRSVADPRGWVRLDGDRLNATRDTLPLYPFDPPEPSELARSLHPLEAEAAVAAVAIMAEEWQSEPRPVRSRPDLGAVLADARTLLDRFGPAASYWTNATAAASDPAPDFLAAGLRGTRSHDFHTSAYVGGVDIFEDLGVIAVSAEEVGVFWSFGAY